MQKHIHGSEILKTYVPAAPATASQVEIEINGTKHKVPETYTVLDACRAHGYFVPTVCHHPAMKPLGRCQVCMVENADSGDMMISCSARVKAGMRVVTDSEKATERQTCAIEELTAKTCSRTECQVDHGSSEFNSIATWSRLVHEQDNGAIRIRPSSCVQCGRCVAACSELQEMDILELPGSSSVQGMNGLRLRALPCIGCGQCALYCPTDAIECSNGICKLRANGVLPRPDGVKPEAPAPGKRISIIQTAPSVRVALGEEFGMEPGSISTGKMVCALRMLGFDYVLDTNFAADLTIMEEATEFVDRLTRHLGGDTTAVLPMTTSCCPAYVNMVEQEFPEFIPNLSSCRSPMGMYGSIIRTYVAEKLGVRSEDIYSCAVMPCITKKMERARPHLSGAGNTGDRSDTDAVITTHELCCMIRDAGIDYSHLQESEYDSLISIGTGAGQIFGVTGGVMEAALRSAYEWTTGKPMENLLYNKLPIHGFDGIKEAVVPLSLPSGVNYELRVAVCSGIKYGRKLFQAIKSGSAPRYDFIEVMACPGGCIGGGGQPRSLNPNIVRARAAAIYSIDERSTYRKSHENPDIIKLYSEFLGKPGSHMAHKLCHTTFSDRSKNYTRNAEPDKSGAETASAGGSEAGGEGEGETLSVVVASMTGKGKALAARIQSESEGKPVPIHCDVQLTQKINLKWLSEQKRFLYITSTFGNGEQPFFAKKLVEEMREAAPGTLSGCRFAVFGLGSKAYPMFCKAAEEADLLLEKLGGTRFTPTAFGDESASEGHEATFGPWLATVWDAMGVGEDASIPTIPPTRYTTALTISMMNPPPKPPGYEWLDLIDTKVIVPATAEREALLMRFNIEGTPVKYETGWHMGILPRNDPAEVDRLCRLLSFSPDSAVVCRPLGNAPSIPGVTDMSLTVREILEQYLDTTGRVSKPLLKRLIPFARGEDMKRLIHLTSGEGAEEFMRDIVQECVTFVDVFEMFPTVRPTFDYVIDMIPPQKQRLYSIASSNLLKPNVIELVVMVVDWKTPKGRFCQGLTTGMFHRWTMATPGTVRVAAFTASSPLQPPEDPKVPITCVAMGVGIAPFRSFCQHREALKKKGAELGHYTIYYGCRRRDEDALCMDELSVWEEQGICKVIWAFSREQAEKVYVTHRLQQNGEQIKRDLGTTDGFLGYCGAAGSAPKGVETEIKKHFKDLGLDPEERWSELGEGGMIIIEAY